MENSWHIHIKGLVQGVGFRPFVHFKAKTFGLTGWISNTTDGVHLEFNAEKETAYEFYKEVIREAPTLSKITAYQISKIPRQDFTDFRIILNDSKTKPDVKFTPDFAICDACNSEIMSSKDKRFLYPFTSCTNCGPRFSILQKLPYDRINTAMSTFQMCSNCDEEYNNIESRRYFSQTNSCPDCAIELFLYDTKGGCISQDSNQILNAVTNYWEEGKIVAIKGIGGYMLTCDAAHTEAIINLRKRKYRPDKPFAVMYPNVKVLKQDVILTSKESGALKSVIAPIVLCREKTGKKAIDRNLIAPNTDRLGVMLPYTPLFILLLLKFGRPIVATSGNISNSPILYEDDHIQSELSQVFDFRLTHNLKIVVPQDDSVLKFTNYEQHRILIRRSRGLAPNYFNEGLDLPQEIILATGASLKSTFCLHNGINTFVSQYLGNIEHYDSLKSYTSTVQHFLELLQCSPEVILSDLHPDYPSTQYGLQLSKNLSIPFLGVQHHLAHFAAVLGENRLQDCKSPILGIVWDGTGYGGDKQIWGGEFFVYQDYRFSREAHFDYFDSILGDKMAIEPRISALSCCSGIDNAAQLLRNKFSATEWQIYQKKLAKTDTLKTSSMGRIFDAVASLLELKDIQTYEGEAAMLLEALAQNYFDTHNLEMGECYFSKKLYLNKISTHDLMVNIVNDIVKGKKKDFIAAKFHYSLMKLIGNMARQRKIKRIALSGGVFQNGLLVDLILIHLKKEFELYFHKDLSPNDENISFGQLMYYKITKRCL